MKILGKNTMWICFLLLLAFCFLFYSEKTTEYAYIGLKTWFDRMIISLFPFMVLINLLIRSGLAEAFVKPFSFFLKPVFRNSDAAIFVILFGFLAGFPLGAKCAVDLYKQGKLSETNAEYLLCFCNNIGPAYMLGFYMQTIHPQMSLCLAIVCFYVLPLLYGILLRYTLFYKKLNREYASALHTYNSSDIRKKNVLYFLPDAVSGALVQIATLGGYMILFNAARIVPYVFLSKCPTMFIAAQSILEISGGLLCIKQALSPGFFQEAAFALVFVFNGLCCHFQTFSLMHGLPLSKQKYMLHKIILCSITVFTLYCFEKSDNIKWFF